MKTRSGFVSNSSSTSFIVSRKHFRNIWDLAWQMVALRHWDSDEELIDKLMMKMCADDPEVDITFSTCNFDTFIHIEGENFWISTCNNHYDFFKLFGSTTISGELPHLITPKRGDKYEQSLLDYIEFYLKDDYDFIKVDADED